MKKYISKNMFRPVSRGPSIIFKRRSSESETKTTCEDVPTAMDDSQDVLPPVQEDSVLALDSDMLGIPLDRSDAPMCHPASEEPDDEDKKAELEIKVEPISLPPAPCIYNKGKRIVIVTNRTDINRQAEWDDVASFVDKHRRRASGELPPHDSSSSSCEYGQGVGADDEWEGPPTWIDFQGMELSDLQQVEQFFGLHHLTIEDILSTDTREKAERVPNHAYYYVVVNELHYKQYSNVLNEVNIVVLLFKNFLLTFHRSPVLCLHQVDRLLDFCPGKRIPSADWVLYALLDGIVDLYIMLVDQTVMEAESLDELVNVLTGVEQNELLARIGLAARRAAHLHTGLWNKREILSALMREDAPIIKDNRIYVQNVFDHVLRMFQKLKLGRQLLGSLNGVYMAKVNLELSLASNDVNIIMRKFASLSSIFLPLTLISGIFGMNVRVPGMIGEPDTPEGYGWFIGIMVFMVLLAIVIALAFRRFKWL
eukprot:TRINITY_DN13402_c0_g1_i1.p1 TRINITY_DN13402_c0_g1~~TRINITY_DN13402_c0_g1_i1.p1  ORF type:complete len:481 (+),score=137.04 TRINITY_DN13402_c0_g1_i1:42-1484(+)